MYKILLADEDGAELEREKAAIEKEFGKSCVMQCAKTGRGVIELAEKFRPEIAVICAQLPGINGIEVMRELKMGNPMMRFIVVSSYDKLDHAMEAVRLGALAYIEKPMEYKTLFEALKNGMSQIKGEREKRKQELLLKEKLETVVPVIESGFIFNLLFYRQFHEDIEHYLTMLELDITYACMLAIVCGDEQQGCHMTNAVGSSVRMHRHYAAVRECVKEYCGGIVGSVMSNRLAVLVPCDKAVLDDARRLEMGGKARELTRQLRRKTGITFRVGIGSVGQLSHMPESYNEAVNALAMTTTSVIFADHLPIGFRYESDYPIELERQLFEEIQKGETDQALRTAGIFFTWLTEESRGSLEEIRIKLLELVLRAEDIACERGGPSYRFHGRSGYLASVTGTEDPKELRQWFLGKLLESCQNVLGKKGERSNRIIEKAQIYIQENYRRDISLDDVSRTVNVSPYYFSKIFKEATGEGFVKYLTAVRMEKAKELLCSTEYSMREIGSLCGYSDPNYFSRSFKKNAGVTPSDYKATRE